MIKLILANIAMILMALFCLGYPIGLAWGYYLRRSGQLERANTYSYRLHRIVRIELIAFFAVLSVLYYLNS